MLELGFLQHWMDIHTAKSNLRLKKCMETVKQIEPEKQANIKPLTLSSLSGAFILLLVGYVTATLAICFELLIPSLWLVCKQASAYKIYTKLKQIVKLNNKPQDQSGHHGRIGGLLLYRGGRIPCTAPIFLSNLFLVY